jgi:hypothetical protein
VSNPSCAHRSGWRARLSFDFNQPVPPGLIIIPVETAETAIPSPHDRTPVKNSLAPDRWTRAAMSTRQKYVLVIWAGWIIPILCVIAGKGTLAFALAAVPIAWWHGYGAAKLEQKLTAEKEAVGS